MLVLRRTSDRGRFARVLRSAAVLAIAAVLATAGTALATLSNGPTPKGNLRYSAGQSLTWAFASGWQASGNYSTLRSAVISEMTRLASIDDQDDGGPFRTEGFFAKLPIFT